MRRLALFGQCLPTDLGHHFTGEEYPACTVHLPPGELKARLARLVASTSACVVIQRLNGCGVGKLVVAHPFPYGVVDKSASLRHR